MAVTDPVDTPEELAAWVTEAVNDPGDYVPWLPFGVSVDAEATGPVVHLTVRHEDGTRRRFTAEIREDPS